MLTEWGIISPYTTRPPVDVQAIIFALGIRYKELPLADGQSGYFRRRADIYEIGVNSNESPQRRRFTAAHELGHYILHRDLLDDGEHFDRLFGQNDRAYETYPFTRDHEAQANRFAADILMPSDRVLRDWAECKNLREVAEKWGVSQLAMRIRLESLGEKLPNA